MEEVQQPQSMSLVKPPVTTSRSPETPYDDGQIMDLSNMFAPLNVEVTDDMILIHSEKIKLKKKTHQDFLNQPIRSKIKKVKSAIVGYRQRNKSTIWKDKSKACKPHTRTTKSLRTLDQVLTSKDGGFSQSSRTHLEAISKKLWLPTETDLVDLGSTLSSGHSKNSDLKSWYSIRKREMTTTKCTEISSQSYTFSHVEKMENVDTIQKNKKKSAKRKTKHVTNNKKICNYIIVNKKTQIGKSCCGEAIENDRCETHNNVEQEPYKFVTETCKHIIKFNFGKTPRKGLPCGKNVVANGYCKSHNGMMSDGDLLRSFRIRLQVPKRTRQVYSKIFGVCNKTYNMCVEDTEVFKSRANKTKTDIVKELRTKYVTNTPYPYMKNVPRQPRDQKVKTYVNNLFNADNVYLRKVDNIVWSYLFDTYPDIEHAERKNMFDKINRNDASMLDNINDIYDKLETVNIPKVSFFSKKTQDMCIEIPKESVCIEDKYVIPYVDGIGEKLYIRRKIWKNDKLYNQIASKKPEGGNKCAVKLIKTRTNKYYMVFSYYVNKNLKMINTETCRRASIDPGSRTTFTIYNPRGSVTEIKDRLAMTRTYRKKIQTLKYLRKHNTDPSLNNIYKYQILNMHERETNRITDFHYKIIKHLSDEYDMITMPTLNIRSIVRQKSLPHIVKTELLILSHPKFVSRLINKAETKGFLVNIVDEKHTTQMCGKCNELNHHVGINDIFKCPVSSCGLILGRDINASRNIDLKTLLAIN